MSLPVNKKNEGTSGKGGKFQGGNTTKTNKTQKPAGPPKKVRSTGGNRGS